MPDALFSIKPIYAKEIFAGRKHFEFRKRPCAHAVERIIIYETAPVCRITGEAEVSGLLCGPPVKLWQMTFSHAGISKSAFDRYFEESSSGAAYVLTKPVRYPNAIPLVSIGILAAPQSYRYLPEPVCRHIRLLAEDQAECFME